MVALIIILLALICLALIAGLFAVLIAWNRAEIELEQLRERLTNLRVRRDG